MEHCVGVMKRAVVGGLWNTVHQSQISVSLLRYAYLRHLCGLSEPEEAPHFPVGDPDEAWEDHNFVDPTEHVEDELGGDDE